jgi:uncharacterized protein
VKLEQSFEVDAPLERVWETLIDVQRVAPCLPGAEVTEVDEDGTYHGTFTVKLGPTTAAYRGQLKIESLDEAARVATMRASGTDKRGQGGAKATMVSSLSERDGGATRVEVQTDFTITGRLARFGRGGMIQDVSNRLLREFVDCLRSGLEAPEPPPAEALGASVDAAVASTPPAPPEALAPPAKAKPISGFRLFFGALLDRLRRALRRSS